ncbi:MAG: hydrogenase expression/formation protein HypE [Chloroflexi bacterium]|nr:hydrogenase expression/formation protein HypE [Chloroflexota bacterium]
MTEPTTMQGAVCPIPLSHDEQIVMGHGSGGKMSHDLIAKYFTPAFDNPVLRAGDDAGVVPTQVGARLAISTDSHVVTPLFFPGGDIGRLSVCGTVNDVAMMGATPLYLTAGFILEEGLQLALLARVIESMRAAAAEAGVQIVAGDTKVVQRGKADGLYITTTGVGTIQAGVAIGGARAQPGDIVILSGTIGDHGIAVLSARGDLGFEAEVQSDIAPLNHLIAQIIATSERVHVLRDPTRGGVGTTLNEIARQSQTGIVIREDALPVRPAVAAACEILGFDPLYVANEGKVIVVVARQDAEQVLAAMRAHPLGADAAIIGAVVAEHPGKVYLRSRIGGRRVVDLLSGEQLPRIC